MVPPPASRAGQHAPGLVRPALDAVAHQVTTLEQLLGAAGAGVLDVLPPPVGSAVRGTAEAVSGLTDLLPALGAELDAVATQLHAQRLSIQAAVAELGALDAQLGVLETSLAPLQAWTHQAGRLGTAVSVRLRPGAPSGA